MEKFNSNYNGFSNQTEIPIGIYIMAISLVGIIAVLIISIRTSKVYTQNPAQTLIDD